MLQWKHWRNSLNIHIFIEKLSIKYPNVSDKAFRISVVHGALRFGGPVGLRQRSLVMVGREDIHLRRTTNDMLNHWSPEIIRNPETNTRNISRCTKMYQADSWPSPAFLLGQASLGKLPEFLADPPTSAPASANFSCRLQNVIWFVAVYQLPRSLPRRT